MRSSLPPHCLASGEAFRRLVDKFPFVLDWGTSMYEILFDFVEPFKGRVHSTGIIGLRCKDVSARNMGKSWNTAVVAVIPGPQAPKNLAPFFQRTVEAIRRLFHQGIRVEQQGKELQHFAVATTCLADGQARVKLGNFVGLASTFGACSWCWWEGVYVPNVGKPGGAVRHMGYHAPQAQAIK